MDSFELNKLLGGLLGAVFVVFSISLASDAIFSSPAPETPGYAIAAAEPEEGASGPAEPEIEPIAVRLASVDIAKGESLFGRCSACHTVESGGANKVGPNLWDIVNRPIAGHEGFAYSGAMKEFSEGGTVVWDYDHLDHFIASPKGLVRGTAMGFAGLKNPQDRADIIAYLHTLSDNPAPLPEVEAEAAAAPEAPAAEEPAAEAPAAEAPAAAEPAAPEAPAAEEPAAEEPAAPNAAPAAGEATPAPTATETAPAAPATETPATETPATETPATETPAIEPATPVAPATDTPVIEQPAEGGAPAAQ
jgi:cytochrome c